MFEPKPKELLVLVTISETTPNSWNDVDDEKEPEKSVGLLMVKLVLVASSARAGEKYKKKKTRNMKNKKRAGGSLIIAWRKA